MMKKILCVSLAVLMAAAGNISAFAVSPASGSDTTIQYNIAPSYTVIIPQNVSAGDDLAISATDINTEPNMQVAVTISAGLTNGNATLIRQDAGGNPETPLDGHENVLSAPVTLGETAVTDTTKLAVFSDISTTNQVTGSLTVGAPDTTGKKAGAYKGTLTFNISYEPSSTQEVVGDSTPIIPNADGEYVAMSGTDWLWFTENAASLSGNTIKLGKDLDMTLYGNTVMANLPEGCTVDGQNHSIKVDINSSGPEAVGLFPSAGGCTVQNLTLEGSIAGTDNFIGIIGAAMSGANPIIITNCINQADMRLNMVNPSDVLVIGGIVGLILTTKEVQGTVHITNCKNEGQITVSGSTEHAVCAGGIIGLLFNVGDNLIQNCTNAGNISSEQETYSAGIIGGLLGNLNINSCTNTGRIYQASADVTGTYPIFDAIMVFEEAPLVVSDCNPSTQNGTFVELNCNLFGK